MTENPTPQLGSYRDRVVNEPDILKEGISEGLARLSAVPQDIKIKAQGGDSMTPQKLFALIPKIAAELMQNEQIMAAVNLEDPTDGLSPKALESALQEHSGEILKIMQQALNNGMQNATLASLADMHNYTPSGGIQEVSTEEREEAARMIEELGSEGAGEEREAEAATAEQEPEAPGEPESIAPPQSAVSLPSSADEEALAQQGMVNLAGDDSEKRKQQLARFSQAEQEKQLAEEDGDGEQDTDGEGIGQAGQIAALNKEKQQARSRQQRSMQIQQSQQRISQAAEQSEIAEAAQAGGGAVAGEAGAKSAKGKLTERGVIKAGDRVGQQIKASMKSGEFKGFAAALAIAIAKDLIDWMVGGGADFGIITTLASLFLGGALTAILLGEGTFFKRMLIKRTVGKLVIGVIAEFIPGFNLFPTYTIGILLMKKMADERTKKIKKQYNIVQSETSRMKKILGRQRLT